MSASNFAFLQSEFQALFEPAAKAKSLVHVDPRTACFYARRTLELLRFVISGFDGYPQR